MTTPKPSELLPCPFCGGAVIRYAQYPKSVKCLQCGLAADMGGVEWNRRACTPSTPCGGRDCPSDKPSTRDEALRLRDLVDMLAAEAHGGKDAKGVIFVQELYQEARGIIAALTTPTPSEVSHEIQCSVS